MGEISAAETAVSRKVDRLLAVRDQPLDRTYLPASLVMATLPHHDPGAKVFSWRRRAFDFELYVRAHERYGMPFGVYPRLLMMWLTNEIKRTSQRAIKLERSYYAFLMALGLSTKGKTRVLFRDQANRLLRASISYERIGSKREDYVSADIADRFSAWWNVRFPEEPDCEILVGQEFFDHVMKHSVPLDVRVINALRRSPLALDLYCWLTFRYFTLDKATHVPWATLKEQFGTEYKETKLFKFYACKYLSQIQVVYPDAKFKCEERHLILYPSKPSISPTNFRHRISAY